MRFFETVDSSPEDKGGNVVLTYGENGQSKWAWKRPESDGSYTYIPLKGDIRFNDVVFGYTDEKVILKHISLYAKPGQSVALYNRFISLGQVGNKEIRIGKLGGVYAVLVGSVESAVTYIINYRTAEKVRILQNYAQGTA